MIGRSNSPLEIFRIFGSVLPRTLHWGLIAAAEGYLLDWSNLELFSYQNVWMNPYTIQVLGTVIGFVLVIRMQIAYARFWEGATQLRTMSSKLGDALMQIISFDEVGKSPEAVFDEAAFDFRLQSIHFCSLFHAVTLIYVRGDDEVSQSKLTLNTGDPYTFKLHAATLSMSAAADTSFVRKHPISSQGAADSRQASDRPAYASPLPGPATTIKAPVPTNPTTEGWSNCSSVSAINTHVENELLDHAVSARSPTPVSFDAGAHFCSSVLPHVGSFGMPHGWSAESPVPLQQVIRARRAMTENDAKLGMSNSLRQYNSVVPTEAEGGKAVQPRSVWKPKFAHSAVYAEAGGSWHGGARRRSSLHVPVASEITVANLAKQDAANHPTTLTRRSSTGVGGAARRGTEASGKVSWWQYLNQVIFLHQSAATAEKLALANGFDVVGGVSQAELGLLKQMPACDRSFTVMNWILRSMATRIRLGGLAIPPPLLSRTYQILSDAMLAGEQAMKLSETPFPYPLRQLLALLLLAFQILVPMAAAAFVDSPALVACISFFVCLGYMSLNSVAHEIEHPFGLGANHLPVVTYQDRFNSKISRLMDLTLPELGYLPEASHSARSGSFFSSEVSNDSFHA